MNAIKSVKLTPRHIRKEWDEGRYDDGGDGYWITLNTGWKWSGDALGAVHAIHEDTRKQAHAQRVMPCTCPDCAPSTKPAA